MTGLELLISGVGSDRSTNCATTTGPEQIISPLQKSQNNKSQLFCWNLCYVKCFKFERYSK